jgi:hypothetical protein
MAESLAAATDSGFRGRLLARGQAQSIIRRAGVLPQDAPKFSPFLDADLLNYGYGMLSTSLHLLEAADGDGDTSGQITLAREGFIQSSYALEAATRNGAPVEDLAFHGLVAGAASHLGGYAARAFSLIQASRRSGRLTRDGAGNCTTYCLQLYNPWDGTGSAAIRRRSFTTCRRRKTCCRNSRECQGARSSSKAQWS